MDSYKDCIKKERFDNPLTYASCSGVSMAPGRAARTISMACSGGMPDSTRSLATMRPLRPRPPMQWTQTFPPRPSTEWMEGLSRSQLRSHAASGTEPSGMGSRRWRMPAGIISCIFSIPIRAYSAGSMRLTRISAPQDRMAARSRARSSLPGQAAIPMRPREEGISTESMRGGSKGLGFVIAARITGD